MKVVINRCYGGAGLSPKAIELLRSRGYTKAGAHLDSDCEVRSNPDVVDVVESLGELSWGECAELKVVEIPDGISWEVSNYDGMECVEETHRSWQ